MSKSVTVENLISTFPYALQYDKTKSALAASVAAELQQTFADNERLIIFPCIDRLNEEILDILAHDFKVDWYLYNGNLETKREQIKSCFYIHRHLGTRKTMDTALSDLCPGSMVEEWNEYGGNPYYFRIILDLTNPRIPVTHDAINNIVQIIKPARAVLEGNSIVYRIRQNFLVGIKTGFLYFTARICGTYPKDSARGIKQDETIVLKIDSEDVRYTVPCAGEICSGVYPKAATQGTIQQDTIEAIVDISDLNYNAPNTGTAASGTFPTAAIKGGIVFDDISVNVQIAGEEFSAVKSGTVPKSATQGQIAEDNFSIVYKTVNSVYASELSGTVPAPAVIGEVRQSELLLSADFVNSEYVSPATGNVMSGTAPNHAVQGELTETAISVLKETVSAQYTAQNTGTVQSGSIPDAASQGSTQGGDINFDSIGGSAGYNVRTCGTPNGSLF